MLDQKGKLRSTSKKDVVYLQRREELASIELPL